MNLNLIHTKNYLLLIYEEAEIKEGKTFVTKDNVVHSNYGYNYGDRVVVAYYPLTKEAKELYLPLLPNPFENKVDIIVLAIEIYGDSYGSLDQIEAFKTGYKAAQSKQFSLEDMYRVAIKVANKVSRPEYGEIININEIVDTYIQSLSTQQLPKKFIPVVETVTKGTDEFDFYEEDAVKAITNLEGKEELVGTYKY